MDNLLVKLNKQPGDCYDLTPKIIEQNGGKPLILLYKSVRALLTALYPNYPWQHWRFGFASAGYWHHHPHKVEFMEDLKKHLKFEKWEDWYKLTKEDFRNFGGDSLFRFHNDSQYTLLTTVYPEYEWLPWLFSRLKYFL
jgi:hypothetical protein